MNSNWKKFLMGAALSLVFFGCSENDDSPSEPTKSSEEISSSTSSSSEVKGEEGFCDEKGEVPESTEIKGKIEKDLCLSAGKEYSFVGKVYVEAGATLTIEAGAKIASGNEAALIVNQGGKLVAEGTKSKPVVFTSSEANPNPGDWGGIVIYGKAPVSTEDGTTTFEAIPTDKFGGDVADDNSGVLKYVRIEYAGNEVAPDQEFNGLTLAGVGSGTTLEYIQVDKGSDDGIEWFGGTASGSYLITSNGQDDGFDIDLGFTGKIKYALNIGQSESYDGVGSDKGVEAGDEAFSADKVTKVDFENLTVVTKGNNKDGKSAALGIKDNTDLSFKNSLFIAEGETKNLVTAKGDVTFEKIADGDFKNNFYLGSYTEAFAIENADAKAFVEAGFTKVNAIDAKEVTEAKAGAFAEGDWTSGWTKEGSLEIKGVEIGAEVSFCDGKTSPEGAEVKGKITSDLCLSAGTEYAFVGKVYVEDGAVLSIEPGTKIASGNEAALIINQGGKLMAEGTKEAPIVMTSSEDAPNPGDWGGIVIYGKSPVSTEDGTSTFEAIPTDKFGGNVADDNSGVLKYLRIEYAGNEVAPDQEFNGLTLAGVGSGTTLEYIQVDKGSDDGIEWFGGTASGSHLITSNGQDDGFDIDLGFTGTIKYALNIGQAETFDGVGSDKGVEAGDEAFSADKVTKVDFENLTVITKGNNSDGKSAALGIKDNTDLSFKKSLFIAEAETKNLVTAKGDVTFEKIASEDFADNFYTGTYTEAFAITDATAKTAVEGGFQAVAAADAQEVIDAKAGALADGDWTVGWTKEGSL